MSENQTTDRKSKEKNSGQTKIIRKAKSIVVDGDRCDYLDRSHIKRSITHALFYAQLPDRIEKKMQFTIGVTSPKKGDGKTVTAANLAAAMALAYNKKTVLVDLSVSNPTLHKVFGAKQRPGLFDSLHNGSIMLSQTRIDQLYLLPSGQLNLYNFGLESIVPVQDVLYSLKQEFEVIIVDLNPVMPVREYPAALANELDGMIIVLDALRTKYADVEKVFNHVRKEQTIGFVMNNVED